MDKKLFLEFARCQFEIFGFPVRIYEKDQVVATFEQMQLDPIFQVPFEKIMLYEAKQSESSVQISIAQNMLTCGTVKQKNSDMILAVGPCLPMQISEYIMKQIFSTPDNVFDPQTTKNLFQYLNTIPLIQIEKLKLILENLCISINNELPDIESSYEPKYYIDKKVYQTVIEHTEKVNYGETEKLEMYDFERRIQYLIRNGMTAQLKKMWKDFYNENTCISEGLLRQQKDNCIMAIGLISNTAMSAGLSSDEGFKLREIYIQQAELCSTSREVMKLRYNILIDFCERVRTMQIKPTDSPVVDRACNFIVENLINKISLDKLAKHCKTNKSYLCKKFREVMGMTIIDFSNLQKINEAKVLLKFTEKPLVEIANYLNFSSQSYFQLVFRQLTGITPKEFRESNH